MSLLGSWAEGVAVIAAGIVNVVGAVRDLCVVFHCIDTNMCVCVCVCVCVWLHGDRKAGSGDCKGGTRNASENADELTTHQ